MHARCHVEWGRRGAERAAARGDVLIVCDILSFSTVVVSSAMRGASVYPCLDDEEARSIAARHGAAVAVRREAVTPENPFSLSPVTFLQCRPGDCIALPSPNGAACCRVGAAAPAVLAGSLLNATAVAKAAALHMNQHEAGLTVLACGERWEDPREEGQLRFALEDYLGAGAILLNLDLPFSPEAAVCRAAFASAAPELRLLLRDCASGVELRDRGFPQDVEHASQLNICDVVPILDEGCFAARSF